jgi:hypothetical protein
LRGFLILRCLIPGRERRATLKLIAQSLSGFGQQGIHLTLGIAKGQICPVSQKQTMKSYVVFCKQILKVRLTGAVRFTKQALDPVSLYRFCDLLFGGGKTDQASLGRIVINPVPELNITGFHYRGCLKQPLKIFSPPKNL